MDDAGAVWLGTSWKMNKTIGEALDYLARIVEEPVPQGVRPFLVPPLTALAAVRDALPASSPVLLGAQNAHWGPEGAGTGEVSMRMVADAGAQLVELGHSERRAAFGESDATVALKVRAALDAGLVPLVCVGEGAEVRAWGEADDFVAAQVRAAFSRIEPHEAAGCLVAYEPVWAIGEGGRPARVEELAPTMAALAAVLADVGGGAGGPLLYGGSVDVTNAAGLLDVPHTDGLFVGRAAWDADGFLTLLEIAGEHSRVRA